VLAAAGAVATAPQADEGVIRLRERRTPGVPASGERVRIDEPRRGFDYEAFEARLESVWFQRKTFLASGRFDDAAQILEQIRSSCAEEGVQRLEHLSGALVAEAQRYYREGSHDRALDTLRFADAFDRDRPQVHLMRAAIHWRQGGGFVAAAGQVLAALRAALVRSVQDLSLFPRLAFLAGLALVAAAAVFALLIVARYQVPLRHEVEELLVDSVPLAAARAAGWAVLGLPLLLWFGAGWLVPYWLTVTFRFMQRGERLVALVLLGACACTMPAYRTAVALFGTAADPAVRTTLLAIDGEYDPDRIVRLRELVETHPDDAAYHFLLAGLYRNGRYLEEAFAEYKEALRLDPRLAAAHVNIGNIFYATGQHGEAVANYRKALDLDPAAFLAHFNMHLAQSEDFRFRAAEESLRQARELDPARVAELLADASSWGDRPAARDATLQLASVWDAALEGRHPLRASTSLGAPAGAGRWIDPFSVICGIALAGCAVSGVLSRDRNTARRCIRCGRPFCQHCKSGREAREYCSQCLHLFVLGDGLAPGIKTRKLYEVERQERRTDRLRKLASLVCPGAGQILRGRTAVGLVLATAWIAALIAMRPALLGFPARLIGTDLRPELLVDSAVVPLAFSADPLGMIAVAALPLLWLAGNAWRWRRREV
jgi:tetratricopeptide (TPR) repeat protein